MRKEAHPPLETCAVCRQPITPAQRPSILMENGDQIHVDCWHEYEKLQGRKPN